MMKYNIIFNHYFCTVLSNGVKFCGAMAEGMQQGKQYRQSARVFPTRPMSPASLARMAEPSKDKRSMTTAEAPGCAALWNMSWFTKLLRSTNSTT